MSGPTPYKQIAFIRLRIRKRDEDSFDVKQSIKSRSSNSSVQSLKRTCLFDTKRSPLKTSLYKSSTNIDRRSADESNLRCNQFRRRPSFTSDESQLERSDSVFSEVSDPSSPFGSQTSICSSSNMHDMIDTEVLEMANKLLQEMDLKFGKQLVELPFSTRAYRSSVANSRSSMPSKTPARFTVCAQNQRASDFAPKSSYVSSYDTSSSSACTTEDSNNTSEAANINDGKIRPFTAFYYDARIPAQTAHELWARSLATCPSKKSSRESGLDNLNVKTSPRKSGSDTNSTYENSFKTFDIDFCNFSNVWSKPCFNDCKTQRSQKGSFIEDTESTQSAYDETLSETVSISSEISTTTTGETTATATETTNIES